MLLLQGVVKAVPETACVAPFFSHAYLLPFFVTVLYTVESFNYLKSQVNFLAFNTKICLSPSLPFSPPPLSPLFPSLLNELFKT